MGDRSLARASLRAGLTKERFYFLMADRFANGSTANDAGGLGFLAGALKARGKVAEEIAHLRALGFDAVQEKVAHTGVVGVLRNGGSGRSKVLGPVFAPML